MDTCPASSWNLSRSKQCSPLCWYNFKPVRCGRSELLTWHKYEVAGLLLLHLQYYNCITINGQTANHNTWYLQNWRKLIERKKTFRPNYYEHLFFKLKFLQTLPTSEKNALYLDEGPSVWDEPESLEFSKCVRLQWSFAGRFPAQASSFSLFAMSRPLDLGLSFFL